MAVRPRDQGGLDPLAGTATLTLLALAALAGLFGGAAAIGLRESFAAISRLLYGFEVESMASAAGALAWWRPFLILGLGALNMTRVTHQLAAEPAEGTPGTAVGR